MKTVGWLLAGVAAFAGVWWWFGRTGRPSAPVAEWFTSTVSKDLPEATVVAKTPGTAKTLKDPPPSDLRLIDEVAHTGKGREPAPESTDTRQSDNILRVGGLGEYLNDTDYIWRETDASLSGALQNDAAIQRGKTDSQVVAEELRTDTGGSVKVIGEAAPAHEPLIRSKLEVRIGGKLLR